MDKQQLQQLEAQLQKLQQLEPQVQKLEALLDDYSDEQLDEVIRSLGDSAPDVILGFMQGKRGEILGSELLRAAVGRQLNKRLDMLKSSC
jgi:type II secretory pathway component PulM